MIRNDPKIENTCGLGNMIGRGGDGDQACKTCDYDTHLTRRCSLTVTLIGRGEWPMVELTACMFKDLIPSQYDDSQLVVRFPDWGVFGVKHVTAKKRAHLVDQVGNPVKPCKRE